VVSASAGLPARIYVPGVISRLAVASIATEGAEVVQTDLVYDDVVALAASSCLDRADQVLVQDTSWPTPTFRNGSSTATPPLQRKR
jgi:diaminopropionate ammonia-lyase